MSRLRTILPILLVAVLLIGTAPATPSAAQEMLVATPAPIPGLAVTRNEAVSSFPDGITFILEARAEAPIVDLELHYHVPGTETLSVELPPFPVGETALAIEHPVSLNAGELPPGLDILYRWRITDANGAVSETSEQMVPWIDSRYEWTPLEGPRVTIYAYSLTPEFQQAVLDSAERTIDRLVNAYGFEPDQHIRLWAYANKDDLYGALAPNSEPWIAGSAYPPYHLIMAILPQGDYDELARVVPHEITHQVEHQVTFNPFNTPPLWLNEGLAVYWQETGRDRFYTYALQLAADGAVPPLRTLNGGFDYNPDGALASYALSLSVAIYILDTWGDEGMANLLATFREGVTYEQAVEQGLGITFDELDQGWQAYLKEKADTLLASGSIRFGDDPVDSGPAGSSLWEDLLVASGTLVLGVFIVIALAAGAWGYLRSRRRQEQEDEDNATGGLTWRDWPEGMEPPGLDARSHSGV